MSPTPNAEAPDGFRYEATVEDVCWTTPVPWPTKASCRASVGRNKFCHAPAIAALRRARNGVNGRTYNWWPYCADHMYGRWVEDGQVMHWRLVPDEVAP